jgi:hypothetical protein
LFLLPLSLSDIFFAQVKDIQGLPFVLAISKLCCPICWDFFQILQGFKPEFRAIVHGFHCALSMVHLPDWIPEELVEAMVSLYSDHLCQELQE